MHFLYVISVCFGCILNAIFNNTAYITVLFPGFGQRGAPKLWTEKCQEDQEEREYFWPQIHWICLWTTGKAEGWDQFLWRIVEQQQLQMETAPRASNTSWLRTWIHVPVSIKWIKQWASFTILRRNACRSKCRRKSHKWRIQSQDSASLDKQGWWNWLSLACHTCIHVPVLIKSLSINSGWADVLLPWSCAPVTRVRALLELPCCSVAGSPIRYSVIDHEKTKHLLQQKSQDFFNKKVRKTNNYIKKQNKTWI